MKVQIYTFPTQEGGGISSRGWSTVMHRLLQPVGAERKCVGKRSMLGAVMAWGQPQKGKRRGRGGPRLLAARHEVMCQWTRES